MVFDFEAERFSVSKVAQRVGVHTATVWRWILSGVRGRRLSSFVIGGRRYVLRRDLDAFLSAEDQSAGANAVDHRQRADDAGKLLDRHGVRPR